MVDTRCHGCSFACNIENGQKRYIQYCSASSTGLPTGSTLWVTSTTLPVLQVLLKTALLL
jgi:hypothetical protein